jgi:hypothetical protein
LAGFAKVDLIFDPMDVAVAANRARAQAQSAAPKTKP